MKQLDITRDSFATIYKPSVTNKLSFDFDKGAYITKIPENTYEPPTISKEQKAKLINEDIR